ncbi:hypothetical protein ALC62_09841 [Cyphomyrmex costatus]|uniref:Uncharacterized protein n=1 Tax=Cyphomyrmex costatus TaxID=456900 RepID=A0A151IF02_9HYME|nr:hypothetical protein ALC62_09841 [Cyphomyrmex costatus]
MLLVNSHILKMITMLKLSAEYNRRFIKGLRAGHSVTEIIRFFGYAKSIVYDIVTKFTALKQFNNCWCKRANNASNCRGGPLIQIIYIK